MKIKTHLLGLLLLSATTLSAQVNKEIYREADVVKSDEKIIYPDAKYDLEQIDQQMQSGTATIKGKMYGRKRLPGKIRTTRRKVNAINQMIYLIPYNNYVASYIRLKDSSEKPKKKIFVRLHDEVFNKRLEGMTNLDGDFTFPNVKPGMYYIFGEVRTLHTSKRKYYHNGQITTNSYGQVIGEGYSSYNEYSSIMDYVDNIVEVTRDGELLLVNVSNFKNEQNPILKDLR